MMAKKNIDKKGKSVNIIGKGKTWGEAPKDGYSIGLTQLILRRPVDLVIDMNMYADGRWGQAELDENKKVMELCKKNKIPYIGLDNYPLKEVMKKFKTDYFGSTVDYAIAYVLNEGFTDIHLYGVTISMGDYARLKAGCDFWCGYAKGLGAEVTVHGESSVMKTLDRKIYGYDIEQK